MSCHSTNRHKSVWVRVNRRRERRWCSRRVESLPEPRQGNPTPEPDVVTVERHDDPNRFPTAHRIGLVNDVVHREELDGAVDDVVEAIQATGRGAVKNSKRAINAATARPDLDSAREVEREIWWEQFATDERRELVEEFNDG